MIQEKSFIEIKKIQHTFCIIGDMIDDQIAIQADCMITNLRTEDCRAGCANCYLNELMAELMTLQVEFNDDPGL